MSLSCPRCRIAMNREDVRPHRSTHPTHVDWCGQCRGIWLDKGEARAVCPTFSDLDKRIIEINALGRAGGGIGPCPRCETVTHAFVIIELEIDYCTGCGGVWLDHTESEGKLRENAEVDVSLGSPYRAIQRAAKADATDCVGCHRRGSLGEMYMSGQGVLCRRCWSATLTEAQAQRVEEAKPIAQAIVGGLLAGLLGATAAGD